MVHMQTSAMPSKDPTLAVTPPAILEMDASPASRPATTSQTNKAFLICGAIALLTAFFVPIAGSPWPLIPAFLPAYQTAVIIAYVITGYLIFAQYRMTRSLALLYLSGGCIYTGAILLAQFLSFPGMFVAQETIFGKAQTNIWLWCFWHVGPSAGILLYIFTEWLKPGCLVGNPKEAARLFGGILVLIFSASIAAVTVFHDLLPILDVRGDFHRITTTGIAPGLQVLTSSALVLLWRVTRFRTTLQVWLGVALFALLCDNLITMLGGDRLSVGWYVGRFNALISATVMLLVYLAEINRAYIKSMRDARKMTASCAALEIKAVNARIDLLTGLPSRALFLEQVEASRLRNVARDISVAILFVDLDGFKQINDHFGHDHGDVVLVKTAEVLRASLRETDIAGRLGGDEFVICLIAPSVVIDVTAKKIAERIVDRISAIGDGIGASVGVALCSMDALEIDIAIRQADQAMYAAKRRGKNRFTFHGRPRLVAVS